MERYTATFVELNGSDIRSFGCMNGGRIFESKEDAWDEIMTDFEATRDSFPNAQTNVYKPGWHAELWDDAENVKIVWEVQKMSSED